MKFAFWNISDKSTTSLKQAIKALASTVDLLVLAENDNIEDNEIESLTGMVLFHQDGMTKGKRWLYIYSKNEYINRFLYRDKHETTEKDEFPIRVSSCEGFNKYLNRYERLLLFDIFLGDNSGRTDKLLLGITHMVSKYSADEMKQRFFAYSVIQLIDHTLQSEPESYQKKCILFGDFNLNPHEDIMADPLCFRSYKSIHDSVSTSSIYGRNPFAFYNPCHYLQGEHNKGGIKHIIPGTYYYEGSIGEKWNIFDQIIFTPSANHLIMQNSIKIITELGDINLLSDNYIPNKDNYSDHLPITFEVNI